MIPFLKLSSSFLTSVSHCMYTIQVYRIFPFILCALTKTIIFYYKVCVLHPYSFVTSWVVFLMTTEISNKIKTLMWRHKHRRTYYLEAAVVLWALFGWKRKTMNDNSFPYMVNKAPLKSFVRFIAMFKNKNIENIFLISAVWSLFGRFIL